MVVGLLENSKDKREDLELCVGCLRSSESVYSDE